MPILLFTVGSLGLATIVGMNIVLFYRILVGDYLGSQKNKTTSGDDSGDSSKDSDSEDVIIVPSNKKPNSLNSAVHHRHLTKDVNRIMRTLLYQQRAQEEVQVAAGSK